MARSRRIHYREKKPHNPKMSENLSQEMFDNCLKKLARGKIPGPDNIPNEILKAFHPTFHDILFLFFRQCYHQKNIPQYWKNSTIILLHEKEDSLLLTNYRPIALANTIYKFYTSTVTALLTIYGEKYKIIHYNQEGFNPQRNTTRQIQTIIATLENACLTNNDIYITYIDFRNAFGSIDHARLLALMKDLGYPRDAVELIGNIYTNSTTSFQGNHFGTTPPIHINRGTIQGDILSPYIFLIF